MLENESGNVTLLPDPDVVYSHHVPGAVVGIVNAIGTVRNQSSTPLLRVRRETLPAKLVLALRTYRQHDQLSIARLRAPNLQVI